MAARNAKTSKAEKPKSSKSRAKTPRKTASTAVDKVVAEAKKVKRKKSTRKSTTKEAKLHKELERLAAYIDAAKEEIAAIRPDDVKDEFLPTASDELDAVVEATADATNNIMDACEVVEGVMGDVSADISSALMDATTRIYEACTFQDITGQRITKVVSTMKHIEERIDALLETLSDQPATKRKKASATKSKAKADDKTQKKPADEDLLNGPQMKENAKSQAEIDDLLASFD